MSPISGLTNTPKAFMEIGRIKKGEMQMKEFTKKGTGEKYTTRVPVDLDYFRFTFRDGPKKDAIESSIRDFYGDRPTELNVRFAYHNVQEVWDANYECYKQGGLIAKAGTRDTGPYWIFYRDPESSEVLVRDGSPVGPEGREFFERPFDVTMQIYKNAKNEDVCMDPVGRLQVVIPEVAHLAVGYFTFQPLSPRDIRNISAELGAYDAIARQYGKTIAGIPFKLIRRKEEVSVKIENKLSKKDSWVIHIEVGGEWGRKAIEAIEQLALPDVVEAEYTEEAAEEQFSDYPEGAVVTALPALTATVPAVATNAAAFMTFEDACKVKITVQKQEKTLGDLNDKQLMFCITSGKHVEAARIVYDEKFKK